MVKVPMAWLSTLPSPKDGAAVLWSLRQIPPQERLPLLGLEFDTPSEVVQVLRAVAERGKWVDADLQALRAAWHSHDKTVRPKTLTTMLDWWSRPAEFGEAYLSALQSYQAVFFAEEEKHIAPYLAAGLARIQEMAARMPVPDLLAEASQGVHFTGIENLAELVLAPSFWSTPFIIFRKLSATRMAVLFGARPDDVSLISGELVPDALLRTLKALADPTRLRILRYLAQEPLTPAQLSRRLRLRAPTVTHHLSALRLAGLVHLTLGSGDDRRYSARLETIQGMVTGLDAFLAGSIDSPKLPGNP